MNSKSEPRVREAALDAFAKEWASALEESKTLERTLERLLAAMNGLDQYGLAQTLTMPESLHQEWWIAYRERNGEMVPRRPEEVPAGMRHEDKIIEAVQAASA